MAFGFWEETVNKKKSLLVPKGARLFMVERKRRKIAIRLSRPGIEPGSVQPQCTILTTVRSRPIFDLKLSNIICTHSIHTPSQFKQITYMHLPINLPLYYPPQPFFLIILQPTFHLSLLTINISQLQQWMFNVLVVSSFREAQHPTNFYFQPEVFTYLCTNKSTNQNFILFININKH